MGMIIDLVLDYFRKLPLNLLKVKMILHRSISVFQERHVEVFQSEVP